VLDDREHVQVYAGHGDGLEEVTGEQRAGLGVEEAGPGCGGAVGCRVDPGVVEDRPYGGRGYLDAEYEEFAVDAPVTPARIVLREAQYQQADRTDRERPARASGPGPGRVTAGQQVPVPAQHCVWPYQQPEPAEHMPWEPVQECGQERPVGRGELRPGTAQLPFQHGDLVAQRQDLGVFVPVAHREEPQ